MPVRNVPITLPLHMVGNEGSENPTVRKYLSWNMKAEQPGSGACEPHDCAPGPVLPLGQQDPAYNSFSFPTC